MMPKPEPELTPCTNGRLDEPAKCAADSIENLEAIDDRLHRQAVMDRLEEALLESFPASDPPSYGVSHV